MDEIKRQLENLFDDMLPYVKTFKHKTYNQIFEAGYIRHKKTLNEIAQMCGTAEPEEIEDLIEELAKIIPMYALEKMNKIPNKQKNRLSVDYNMNMAVYVVPFINYSHDEHCEKIAKKMVEIWNRKGVTSLTLSYSSYEDISQGFKKTLCYITTAVCENQKKPDNCYELELLRTYRDQYLMRTEEGRSIVEDYYDIAPSIVMALQMQKDSDKIYDQIYDSYLMPCIRMIEAGKNEECKHLYMDMVCHLQSKYLYS